MTSEQAVSYTSDSIRTNGIDLHYYRTGGDLPPMILLHGLSDNGLCWLRVIENLQPEYDLIIPDARGHGFSDKPQSGYTPIDHAADVAGLIEALGVEKLVVMGHSMGADTAATLAANYPHLVSAVILEDPPWRHAIAQAERIGAMADWRDHLLHQQATMNVDDLMQHGREINPTWDEIELSEWANSTLQLDVNALNYITEPRPDWRETCKRIQCPTFLLVADIERGAMVSPEYGQEAGALLARGKVVRIEGAGHSIRRENFDSYMDHVRNFLAEI
jgi:pimeloyl-ACP methyl ester carboxylesterase